MMSRLLGTSPRWLKIIRDLWDNKGRTFLVVLSTAIGVIAFGGLFATRTNVLGNMDNQFQASNAFDISMTLSGFDDEVVRWAARQPGISAAQGLTVYTADLIVDEQIFDVTITSFADFNNIAVNKVEPESGNFPPGRGEILLERSNVESTGVQNGDEVTLVIDDEREYTMTFTGTLHDVNKQPGFISETQQVYVSPRTLYRMGLNTQFNRLYLVIDRSDLFSPGIETIADNLRDDLQRQGVEVRAVEINELREHWASDNIAGLSLILVVIGSFSLLLSGFLVVNTIAGFLAQQKRQIGVMKIIGASRSQIIVVYLVMAACFGFLAMLIAIPVSSLLGRALANVIGPQTINFDIEVFRLPFYLIGLEVAVVFLAPLLSALGPILSGTSVTAAQAISDYASTTSNNPIDVALAKVGGLPRPILLSLRNTFRRKIRLLMTLITLVIAGSIFLAILNVRAAVETDVQDIVALSSGDVQVNLKEAYNKDGVLRRAELIENVAYLEGWYSESVNRIRPGDQQGESYSLQGVPYASGFMEPDMLEGHWLLPLTPDNRWDIVVGHPVLDTEPDVKVGDSIVLSSKGHEQTFHVVGVVYAGAPPGSGAASIFAHYDSVVDFADVPNEINTVLVRTTDDSRDTQERVEAAIIDEFDRYGIDIAFTEINRDRLESILDAFDVIISLLLTTAVLIAIVGGLGLAGTMSLSVLERTREIGVMRSVGASTNVLRLMFIGEGVLIGVMSYVLALLLSVPATYAFGQILGLVIREKPWSFVYTLSGPLLWLVIILVVSAIASVMPAQRASQISIREALAYE